MTEAVKINQKWLKASVLGCLWASSEILLGSFLHNLRIPFSGNILTAIGVVLLISVSYIWNEKGLFWRSGLVCALMKAISPSAVIWGPMIAIFSEALLMEFSVRVFGRNYFGFAVAGMLAMSWNLFHKIINFIIFYGFDIVRLFENITIYALKQLDIQSQNVWLPILFLWGLYLIFGLIAAFTGVYIGKKVKNKPSEIEGISFKKVAAIQAKKGTIKFPYSIFWLITNVVGIIGFLFLINMANWIYWTVFGTALLVTWAIRYHKALKTLQKPKFWISFVVITMLSSYIFSKFQNFDKGVWDGLYIGLQMNFRAAIMVIGFTVIGKEFSNPQIGKFLQKTNFRQLFLSLEVAFETLPFVMANLPSFKDFFKQPVSIIYKMISQAEFWLGKITVRLADKPMIYIITGSSGDGKTSVLKDLIDALKTKNIKVSGFISPAVVADNKRIGYDLLDLSNGKNTELSRGYELHDSVKIGKFHFCKMGVEFGNNALQLDNTKDSQLICVDEVGPWEMDDKGWASGLNNLLMNSKTPMIWVVRQSLVDEVIENWNLKKNKIFDVNNTNKELLIDEVVHGLLI